MKPNTQDINSYAEKEAKKLTVTNKHAPKVCRLNDTCGTRGMYVSSMSGNGD